MRSDALTVDEAEWPLCPLGTLSTNYDARRVPVRESDRRVGAYPYYGASGVVDFVDDYLFDGEYLLVAEDGENLHSRKTPVAFLATGKFWVNNHAHVLCGNDRALTRFLAYAVENSDISGYLTGAVMPKLTKGNLERIIIPCPPLAAQQHIVDLLGALDDKIALNTGMNRTLEAMAAALFRKWCDDNEGVARSVRTEDLIQRDALLISDGYRAKNAEMASSGLPFARAGNLQSHFDFSGADLLGEPGVLAAREKLSQPFDCVFTSKGTVGRIAQVLPSTPRFVYSPQLCFWRSLQPLALNPFVLNQWMNSDEFREQIDAVKGQTDMADYVSLRDQRRMTITLPFDADQAVIGSRLESLSRLQDSNMAQSRTLAALRDTLLPQLLSGSLRLRGAEHAVSLAV